MDGVAQRKRHPPQRGVRSSFSKLLGSSSVPAAVSMTLSRPFVPRWRVQPFRGSFVLISPFIMTGRTPGAECPAHGAWRYGPG